MAKNPPTTPKTERLQTVVPHDPTATSDGVGQPTKLLRQEWAHMKGRLKKTGHRPPAQETPPTQNKADPGNLMGLALSGGGIRSATFSLGVMQALARAGWMKKMDYLSTVSGGGYIGSGVTWWASGKGGHPQGSPFGDAADNFAYGTDGDAPVVQRLRERGNYLRPGGGITLLSGFSVVLRAIMLSVLVWFPVTVFALALLHLRLPFVVPPLQKLVALLKLGEPWRPVLSALGPPNLYETLFWSALAMAALFVLFCLVYSLATLLPVQGVRDEQARYRWRRRFEAWSHYWFIIMAAAFFLGTIPIVAWMLGVDFEYAGLGSVIAGIAIALRGAGPMGLFKGVAGMAKGVMDTLKGSGLAQVGGAAKPMVVMAVIGGLIYAFLVSAYGLSNWVYCNTGVPGAMKDFWYCTLEAGKSGLTLFGQLNNPQWLWSALILTVVVGWAVNLNYISIHRFYRDRLMEAFLPGHDSNGELQSGASTAANTALLADMWDAELGAAPYHLINTNLVLVNSHHPKRRARGGDNFLLSPLFCGSNATGWVPTSSFSHNKITLATAMAISGAAVNPFTGVGGVGLTRNRVVSLLMALLNIRLGYWARNPRGSINFLSSPNYFLPGFYGIIGEWGFQEDSAFFQLSDGGHFENTGLYELARRRVRLIVLCDGGADPEFSFGDMVTAMERIQSDFGARIEFSAPGGDAHKKGGPPPDGATHPLSRLIPKEDAGYPKGETLARQGHLLGEITYADDSRGVLILLKTTLVPGLPMSVLGYKGLNPDFPDQSTADQFFDEEQFEAYRLLGLHIAEAMLQDPEAQKVFKNIG